MKGTANVSKISNKPELRLEEVYHCNAMQGWA